MAFQKFLIAPLDSGLVNNVKPWLIPDSAWALLRNAYAFRGRLRKRPGSYLMNPAKSQATQQLYSRLRIDIGTTDVVTGNFVGIVPGALAALGQIFSIGDTIFTIYQNGLMYTTGSATGTVVLATGTVTITGNTENPLTPVYWYPSLPVMGLFNLEDENINEEPIIAFDTKFAYTFDNLSGDFAWSRLGTAVWTGTDSQFFWADNYRGATAFSTLFFVVNYNEDDQIKYWDTATWTTFNPTVFDDGMDSQTLETSRLLISFKNRILALNTKESLNGASVDTYVNRCRFSQVGDPTDSTLSWREDVPQRGGWVDAPTKEAIVTAEFIKDHLIVYFERSTWELVYLDNETFPFTWQLINEELGAESTNSIIPFDKVALGVGQVGIHACNGANVERIDDKIPDEVFKIHNGNLGVERVSGIRDYNTELVYWTFPDFENSPTYPNRILCFNYVTGSWSFFDDSATVFGYYQPETDTTWADLTFTWEEWNSEWDAAQFQSQNRRIVAGNQQGWVWILDPDIGRNSQSLQITNATDSSGVITITSYNHNLQDGEYIAIENVDGLTGLDGFYPVYQVLTANTFTVQQAGVTGTYSGNGTVARVSRVSMFSKQYNFFTDTGRNLFISKGEFMVDRTDGGGITLDYFASSTDISTIDYAEASGAILGTSVLDTFAYDMYPLEQQATRLWHPVYFQIDGECIQIHFYFSDDQMVDEEVVWGDFVLHAMLFHAMPTGRLQ